MTRAYRALFALFAVVAPLYLSAPLKKRSSIDTTLRLGLPVSPTSPPKSSISSVFSINAVEFREGEASRAAAEPLPRSNTFVYRPFSLGGSGTRGSQADRPLAGAFSVYSPPTRTAPIPHVAVDKAAVPGASRNLASPKAETLPREKQTTKLWSKLDSAGKPVEDSASGPSSSVSPLLNNAPMVDQNLNLPKQPTEHVNPSLTPWSYYRSNYFKQSPPKIFYRNVFMPQASNRFQARIEALQAATSWLKEQPSSYRLSRVELGLLTTPFTDWRSIGTRLNTARQALAPKATKDLIRQAKQDRLSILGLEDLLQRIASKAIPVPR